MLVRARYRHFRARPTNEGTWATPSPITNWTGATSDLGAFALNGWPAPGASTAVALAGYDAGYEALPGAQEFVLAPAHKIAAALPPGTAILSSSAPFAVGGEGAPELVLAWVSMPAQAGGVPPLPGAGRGDLTVAQAPPREEGVQALAVAVGGYEAGDFCAPTARVEAFVPSSITGAGAGGSDVAKTPAGVWVELPLLAYARADAAAGWADGRLFIAGGEGAKECSEFSRATDHVEEWVRCRRPTHFCVFACRCCSLCRRRMLHVCVRTVYVSIELSIGAFIGHVHAHDPVAISVGVLESFYYRCTLQIEYSIQLTFAYIPPSHALSVGAPIAISTPPSPAW